MRLSSSVAAAALAAVAAQYTPDWNSLDSRPLPPWYDQAKIGIFIHWGIFSVPSWGTPTDGASGEWFWWQWQGAKNPAYVSYINDNYPPNWSYQDFGPSFTGELYNATEWANLFSAAGAKYVVRTFTRTQVLTSKHHEGFCNWANASMCWGWNAVDNGPHRDLVGELASAVRQQTGIHFGLYHSLFEWFNPLYLADKASGYNTTTFVTQKTMPELYQIVNQYQPELIWSDGDWEASDDYWMSRDFIAWLFNSSPVKDTVVVNDRWGAGDICKHGSYWTCNDRYSPGTLQPHKWENAFTLDRWSWGFRRNLNIADVLSVYDIVSQIASTVACGGNALINIGPARDGSIPTIFQDRLLGMGEWLAVNGEAIYSSVPWRMQNETAVGVWYTSKPGAVYAIALQWPTDNVLTLTLPVATAGAAATLLGSSASLTVTSLGASGVRVSIPPQVVSALPSTVAWVFKLTGVN